MLVLLPLLLLSVWARDESPPKDSNHLILTISSCPDAGYFFRRQQSPNALGQACFLCFCQADATAVCWQRENRRCDGQHYQHGVKKRETRVRRSPIGLSDIFFRDAARDLFNKQMPQTCKPYETSFSEGCPPADWCTGCTVCDCDANGRWDCHILSFCPDKEDKSKMKHSKTRVKGPPPKTTKKVKKQVTPALKTTRKTTKKPPIRNNPKPIKYTGRSNSKPRIPKINNTVNKPKIMKKDSTTKKTVSKIKTLKKDNQIQLNRNETAKITQEVYKKVVSAIHKMISKKFSADSPMIKNLQKRSLEKKNQPCVKNSKNAKKNVNGKFKSAGPNKKQFKKIPVNSKNKSITQKKKYGPSKKKPTPAKNKRQNKNVKRNYVKKNKPTDIYDDDLLMVPDMPSRMNWRMKRELNDNITDIVNGTLLSTSEIPMTESSNLTTIQNVNITNGTSDAMNNYYKYSVVTQEPYIDMTNIREKLINPAVYFANITIKNITTEKNVTQAEIIREDMKKEIISNLNVETGNNSKLEMNTPIEDFNELKSKKWSQFKIIKNDLLANTMITTNSTMNSENSTNNNISMITPRTHTKDVKRIVTPYHMRRYNKSRIVNTLNCKTRNSLNTFKERIYRKIDDLQSMLKTLLIELRKDNINATKTKPKRFNVSKYLKKIFRKVFRNRKGKKGTIAVNDQPKFNKHIIDTICSNFGDCDMTQVNNAALNRKIKELYDESFVILRSINIIKGLLRLLEFPKGRTYTNGKIVNVKNQSPDFKDDIHKLNAILKDRYLSSDHQFTDSEITQINYIKQNTKTFIQSVGKFAATLDEIIYILTNKSSNTKKNVVTRDVKSKKNKKAKISQEHAKQLKNLLEKYTFIQGTLVQTIQSSMRRLGRFQDDKQKQKIVEDNKDTTAAVMRYSDHIVQTLKKLKKIAMSLNNKNRRRRGIMRDEAGMEYLLTLMEYLLKQNHPLDAAPVNDGIDLLIEAIKSAPDIKPIKKKVLQAVPIVNNQISLPAKTIANVSKEDSALDSNKISKEDNAIGDVRSETIEHVDKEYQPNTVYQEKETDQIEKTSYKYITTEAPFFKKGPIASEATVLETTVVPRAYEVKGRVEYVTEHNNFEKLEKAVNEDNEKVEVFIGDVDDDDSNDVTSTTPATDTYGANEVVTISSIKDTTEFKLPEIKDRQKINSIDVSGSSNYGEKRVPLDWLDESDEQDTREAKFVQNTTVEAKTEASTASPVSTSKQTPIHADNISSITKEFNDEEERKNKLKMNIEEIMLKKQMDLLNSLDYGTEKSESDDSDSKDGDERYSGDAFPAYFV